LTHTVVTLVHCDVYTKLEGSTAFLFRDNRRHGRDGRTDGRTDRKTDGQTGCNT